QWERLGFQGSRIDLLGEGALYVGDANAYRKRLDRIAAATSDDVVRAARMWVDGYGYILTAVAQSAGAPPASASIGRTRPATRKPRRSSGCSRFPASGLRGPWSSSSRAPKSTRCWPHPINGRGSADAITHFSSSRSRLASVFPK